MPPPGTSHMHAATTPPGFVTRPSRACPARVAHEGDDERGERGVELAVVPRQLLGAAHAHVGARVALPAGVGELLGGVDGGHVAAPSRATSSLVSPPGPQPTSSARMPGCTPAASASATASRGT